MEKETVKEYTREWFVEQGRKGGMKVKKLYGIKHYSRMGKIGKRKKQPLDNPPV